MAQEAVSALTIVTFLGKETPVNGDPSRIPYNWPDHADEEEDEKDVEDYEPEQI